MGVATSEPALDAALATLEGCALGGHGFLPQRVPTSVLPEPLEPHARACAELPAIYHGADADARPWLSRTFATWDPSAFTSLSQANGEVLDAAMSAVATLAHAYRWGAMPPVVGTQELSHIELPPGIGEPLQWLSARLGVPPCGNLFHMVIANWRLATLTPGGTYAPAALRAGAASISPLCSWLRPPEEHHLTATIRSVVITEAVGAEIMTAVVRLVGAAARRDVQETAFLLDKLRSLIGDVANVLAQYMRPQQIAPEVFLSVIQPHFLWGLQQLDGASGAQTPTVQLLDSAFGVRRESPIGQTIHHSRHFMLPAHRRVFEAVDAAGPLVRSFVAQHTDEDTLALWNDCLKGLLNWRRTHQKRGAMYLRAGTSAYRSVSGVVAQQDVESRATAYEAAMDEHVRETDAALVPREEGSAPRYAFRFLSAADLAQLEAGGVRRPYAPGEMILEQGSRRQGLFIVRRGLARVRQSVRGSKREIADIIEGEVFGELSFIENSPAIASVVAGVDGCEVDVIPPEHIYLLLAHPEFAQGFYHSLAVVVSRRFRAARVARLHSSSLLSGRERLPRGRSWEADGAAPPGPDAPRAEILAAGGRLLDQLAAAEHHRDSGDALVADIIRDAYGWLMTSEVLDLLFRQATLERPFSPRAIASLVRPEPRGVGERGALVDEWFRSLPTSRWLATAPERIIVLLKELAAGRPDPLPVMLLDLGPCWFVPARTNDLSLKVTCLSDDPRVQAWTEPGGPAAGASRVQVNVLGIARGEWRLRVSPQRLIVADLVSTWLSDEALEDVISWMYANLEEGGVAVLGGLDAAAPDRLLWDRLLQLSPARRSAEAFANLFTRSAFDSASVTVERSADGAGLYAIARRRRWAPDQS
jgi:CRP-like cAMP-binding protein